MAGIVRFETVVFVPRNVWAVLLVLAALAVASFSPVASADEQGYGFVLADQPTTDRYVVSGNRAYNDAGGEVEITRSGVGTYAVHFDRFDQLTPVGGHVQVTAVATTYRDCKVTSWLGEYVGVRCVDETGSPADSAFSLLHLRPTRGADHVAFAWANDATAPAYTPHPDYSHNGGALDPIEIQRSGTGRYFVEFRNFAATGATLGHPQVTAYGDDSNRCQLQRWVGDFVYVECYDGAGAPVDTRFTVLFLEPSATDRSMAFAWADAPLSASYAPDSDYAHHPLGAPVSASRLGVGHYEMEFSNLGTLALDVSNVQVSAYGFAPVHCQLEGWGADTATVRCFDSSGMPVDAFYNVFFQKALKTDWTPEYAFATAWDVSNPSYSLTTAIDAWNPTGGEIRVTRSGVGSYRVEFEAFETIPGGGNVQVSAVSTVGRYCNPERWNSRFVYVVCFDRFGVPADTAFNVFWLKAQPGDGTVGYAWGEYPFADSYSPSPTWAHSPTGQPIFIERLDVGRYEVGWTDVFTPLGPPRPLHHQVAAYDSSAICGQITESSDPLTGRVTAGVKCVAADGSPVDSKFSILLAMPESHHRSIGFGTAVGGSLALGSDFNSADRPVVATDWGSGLGEMYFEELAATGLDKGTLQITPIVSPATRCAVADWTSSEAWAHCVDEFGNPVSPSYRAMMIYRTAAPEPGFAIGLFGAIGGLAAADQSRKSRRNR